MQVYKLFMKILKSQLGQVIMYIGIFTGILFLVTGQKSSDDSSSYKMTSLKIAINDLDNTSGSEALKEFITDSNQSVDIENYNTDTIQDELYNRNINAAVIIPDGYETKLASKNINDIIDVYTLSNTMTSDIITSEINNYITNTSALIQTGSSPEDALALAKNIADTHADVNLLDKETNDKGLIYYFFSYIAYVFLCVIFVGGLPIVLVLNKKNIRSRIECSSYKFAGLNTEIFLGLLTFGAIVSVVFIALAAIFIGGDLFTIRGALFIINMLIYMILSVALAFLIGQLIKKENIISVIANVIGLGFSFLGGVFVPLSVMGEGVIKLAHFLPSYWYILASEFINSFHGGDSLTPLMQYIGVEMIFAATFFIAGFVTIKAKQNS